MLIFLLTPLLFTSAHPSLLSTPCLIKNGLVDLSVAYLQSGKSLSLREDIKTSVNDDPRSFCLVQLSKDHESYGSTVKEEDLWIEWALIVAMFQGCIHPVHEYNEIIMASTRLLYLFQLDISRAFARFEVIKELYPKHFQDLMDEALVQWSQLKIKSRWVAEYRVRLHVKSQIQSLLTSTVASIDKSESTASTGDAKLPSAVPDGETITAAKQSPISKDNHSPSPKRPTQPRVPDVDDAELTTTLEVNKFSGPSLETTFTQEQVLLKLNINKDFCTLKKKRGYQEPKSQATTKFIEYESAPRETSRKQAASEVEYVSEDSTTMEADSDEELVKTKKKAQEWKFYNSHIADDGWIERNLLGARKNTA